jgi:hypothetical protein
MFGLIPHHYIWHEAAAHRGANKITSTLCLHKHVLNTLSNAAYVRRVLSSGTYRAVVRGAFCKQIDLLVTGFVQVFFLAYSSTLNMEATCYSETSVDFKRTTRRYIPAPPRERHIVTNILCPLS